MTKTPHAEIWIVKSSVVFLLVLTVYGFYRIVLSPVLPPAPAALNQSLLKDLQNVGWSLDRQVKAVSNYAVVSSTGLKLERTSTENASETTMLIIPVRARSFSRLDVISLSKSLGIGLDDVNQKYHAHAGEVLLTNTSSGATKISTCISRLGRVSSKALPLRDSIKSEPISPLTRIQIILGLMPPRNWSCLLVQLESRDTRTSLLNTWRQNRDLLVKSWLRPVQI